MTVRLFLGVILLIIVAALFVIYWKDLLAIVRGLFRYLGG